MKNIYKCLVVSLIMITIILIACNRPTAHVVEYYENDDEIDMYNDENNNKIPKLVYYYVGDDSTNCREVQYYENGRKKMEGTYVNDLRDGMWKAWYRNGQLWSEGKYVAGYAEGTRRVYYSNGQEYIVGDYVKGEKVGEWVFYDSLGVVLKRINY